MKEPSVPSQEPAQPGQPEGANVSGEVDEVRRVLEEARQRVKPIVKRELEGEVVSSDLLNFRLKNARFA